MNDVRQTGEKEKCKFIFNIMNLFWMFYRKWNDLPVLRHNMMTEYLAMILICVNMKHNLCLNCFAVWCHLTVTHSQAFSSNPRSDTTLGWLGFDESVALSFEQHHSQLSGYIHSCQSIILTSSWLRYIHSFPMCTLSHLHISYIDKTNEVRRYLWTKEISPYLSFTKLPDLSTCI